jgi:hypothetical protein
VTGAVVDALGIEREADQWLPVPSAWPLLELVDG